MNLKMATKIGAFPIRKEMKYTDKTMTRYTVVCIRPSSNYNIIYCNKGRKKACLKLKILENLNFSLSLSAHTSNHNVVVIKTLYFTLWGKSQVYYYIYNKNVK